MRHSNRDDCFSLTSSAAIIRPTDPTSVSSQYLYLYLLSSLGRVALLQSCTAEVADVLDYNSLPSTPIAVPTASMGEYQKLYSFRFKREYPYNGEYQPVVGFSKPDDIIKWDCFAFLKLHKEEKLSWKEKSSQEQDCFYCAVRMLEDYQYYDDFYKAYAENLHYTFYGMTPDYDEFQRGFDYDRMLSSAGTQYDFQIQNGEKTRAQECDIKGANENAKAESSNEFFEIEEISNVLSVDL